jgi:transposase
MRWDESSRYPVRWETHRMKTTTTKSEKAAAKEQQRNTIGIDLGDKWSHYCTLDDAGEIIEEGRFRTTPQALDKHFGDIPAARVAIESGTHSIWVSEHLRDAGHEVLVANVRDVQAISQSDRKSDRVDAEKLARYARVDPRILNPVTHRSVAMQES